MKTFIRVVLPFLISIRLFFYAIIKLNKQELSYWIMMLSAIIIFIIGLVQYSRRSKKCKKCGQWNAMHVVEKELVKETPTHKIKTLKDTNKEGKVIRTREVTVPATKYTYHIYEQCSFCSEIKDYITDETVEN